MTVKTEEFTACSNCGAESSMRKFLKSQRCAACGSIFTRNNAAPSPEQIATGAEEQRKLRKYPVPLEDER